ncbi:MAG TPA: rhombosortase [Thermoanaerobaculia bacterium]|nr:rhombosortase [Thermoanaerobaculia bacterium]
MKTVGALTLLAIVCTLLDGSHFELTRDLSEPWRIVTCHFTHWSHEQLAWDALAFAGLGIACMRNNLRAFHATLLASLLLIPIAVHVLTPHVTAYRGLSGIDSALFALLLVQSRRSPLALACALGFVAKIAFETFTGGAVFASNMGADVVALPVAHLAGASIGTIVAILASYTRFPCASLSGSSGRC